ncbi:OmpA family protein [Phaeovibrio sulfidiphilus]|uniref:OmpA family protein n=1 Tax=Phaeovibrio sulfidiphilus TaxID=1220600 RepID=A0A8J6YQR4_9PROT|nr:OmpA family protein [Phaeovibrio sulfidiphilus]MBE1237627.1 OmpA family protein [Phaeovibrio sulfidiphilus]
MVQTNRKGRNQSVTMAVAIGLGLAGALSGTAFVSDAWGQSDMPSARTEYPDVNRVPQQAPPAPTAKEMRNVTEGLAADRDRVRAAERASGATGDGQAAKAKYGKVGGPSRSVPSRIAEPTVSGVPAAAPRVAPVAAGGGVGSASQPERVTYGRSQPPRTAPEAPQGGTYAPGGAYAQPVMTTRQSVPYGRGTAGYGYGSGSRPVEARQRIAYGRSAMPHEVPGGMQPGAEGMMGTMGLPSGYELPGGILVDSSGERAVDAQTVGFLTVTPGGGFPANFIPSYSTLVGEIYFAASSSGLDGHDMAILRDIADYQRANGGYLRVTGHASSRTADMSMARHDLANLQVSNRRAEAVRRALERLGVPPGAIFSSAESDRQAVYQEVMPSGEAFNRRVEIYLEY